jgi:phospholipase C
MTDRREFLRHAASALGAAPMLALAEPALAETRASEFGSTVMMRPDTITRTTG